MVRSYRRPGPRVLCWHDSVWVYSANEDTDRRPVFEMLAEHVPGVAAIGRGGWHARLFLALARALVQLPHHPEVVAMPATLPRVTAVQWRRRPDLIFAEPIADIERWAARGRGPTPWRRKGRHPTPEEWAHFETLPSPSRFSALQTVGDFHRVQDAPASDPEQQRRRYAELFAFHFGHPPDPGHPRIVELRDTVALLASVGIRSVVYVTPFNVAAGTELLGPEFAPHVQAHIDVASAVLRELDTPLHDFHDRLGPEVFLHPYHSAEHVRSEGKAAIATWVADAIRRGLA